MPMPTFRVLGAACLWLALSPLARAQKAPNNDGFQRRDGKMLVVRNGQARPMTRDAHLPTGATVTTDGFVVSADGQRTELREGQGCDLRGRPVAVRTAPNGALTLSRASAGAGRAATPARTVMEEMFGLSAEDEQRLVKYKKPKKEKKKHGKDKEHEREKEEDDD